MTNPVESVPVPSAGVGGTGMAAIEEPGVEFAQTPDGPAYRVRLRGRALLSLPLFNRGTTFTWPQREAFGLVGLLPTGVSTLESQVRRVYARYLRQPDDLEKHVYLTAQRDRNEVLFYRLLADHISEMLPIIYTPTVGLAIQRWSHEYRRPRGIFLSIDQPEEIEAAYANFGLGPDDIDLVVATDAEGILGIGDWGVGGVDIAIGKLAVYTAAAGIPPGRGLPVVLDVGTDNLALLNDPMYLGNRHARIRGARYDEFVDAFVTATTKLYPNALLHWEDMGTDNARRLLERYSNQICTFNDDMQGTAAVVLAAVRAGVRAARSRLRDQRVVVHGAGTAGTGIADMLREAMVRDGLAEQEAYRRFWFVDRPGLLTDDTPGLRGFQVPYARPARELPADRRELADVVAAAHPTVLIGSSTAAGAFTEQVVREMARHVERPIVLPLSNPTARAEADPRDVLAWTQGRALVATGSPFPTPTVDGQRYEIAQANNALVFPGLGLGVIVCRASRISAGMLHAAADALASIVDTSRPGAPLLPPVDQLRMVSATVALAVATAAAREGLARVEVTNPVQQVQDAMWNPEYPRLEPA